MSAALLTEIEALWGAGTSLLSIVTVEEERAIAVCREAARRIGATFAVWSSHRGLDPIDPSAKSPGAVLDAIERAPAPLFVVLLDFHVPLAEPGFARRMRDLLPWLASEDRCLAMVSPRNALPEGLATDTSILHLGLPDEVELQRTLHGVAQQFGVAPLTDDTLHRAVSAAAGLTGLQARRAFARGLRVDGTMGAPALQAILQEKKRILSRDLGLDHIETTERPEEIGGLESFKAWLTERAQGLTPEARKFGIEAPRGVLLLGVQGCGKSLSAKCSATQLGVPLLRLDLPRVLGSAGEGQSAEENLRRALFAAEAAAPVALWVDEIEKGFAGSTPGRTLDSRASRLLGAFSTWLQERKPGIFVVATANDVTSLPPELLRRGRFDELFFVDLPDFEARVAILRVHMRRRNRDAEQYDLAALAQLSAHFSGAELEQVVVGALHRAFAAKRPMSDADLRRVAQDMIPLYRTYEEQIKELREWARGRARSAGREGAIVDLFRRAKV